MVNVRAGADTGSEVAYQLIVRLTTDATAAYHRR